MRAFRGTIILATLVGLLAGAIGAALIALINTQLSSGLSRGGGLAWSYVALTFGALASNGLSQTLLIKLAQETSFDLRLRLSREILSAPLRRLEELGPHRLMANLTEDIPAITSACLGAPSLCINLATPIACLVYLGWLSPLMLAGVLLFLLVGAGIRQLLAARGLRYLKLAREESNLLLNHYRAMIEGGKELKLHGRRREVFLDEEIRGAAQTLRRHNLTGLSIYTLAEGWSKLLFYVFFGVLLFVLPAVQIIDARTLTGYIMGPFSALMNFLPIIGRARVALKHVEELSQELNAADKRADLKHAPTADPSWGRLQLVGVTHTYRRPGEEGSFSLGPIDLQFSPGEIVYLVGGNGSGKTSLAKLVTGLYAPESGEIRLDGRRVTDENRESYRQLFSAIFSDFYLFERLMGVEGTELDRRATRLLKKLRLDHQVTVKDGALSRVDLSFGQRKRLALLTAFLDDRPFYVFDEWTAGQDPEFRDLFYLQFLPELKRQGKTILAITHDENYFRFADRLIKLDYGRITESAEKSSEGEILAWPSKPPMGWSPESSGKGALYERHNVTHSF
jgi:putative ATP-binding cassette transporter